MVCLAGVLAAAAAGFARPASPLGVSAAFQPWASSFMSASSGFVLGGIGCHFEINGAQPPCRPIVVATSDGGRSWRMLSAPPTLLPPAVTSAGAGGPAVRAITFADPRNGWLYNPGLWATHDGGAHWTRSTIKGFVLNVVAGGGWAYAAVASANGIGAQSPSPTLLRSPVGRDDWRPVASLQGNVETSNFVSLLAASGNNAWAGTLATPTSTADLLWRSIDGAPWQQVGNPCASGSLASLNASSPSDLVMLCAGRTVQIATSTDAGTHTHLTTAPGTEPVGPLAAPTNTTTTMVLATPNRTAIPPISGSPVVASWLARTDDGGRSWTRSAYQDHDVGWADLQFSSPTVGWVIHGYPGASIDQLLRTTNAGKTFTPVRF